MFSYRTWQNRFEVKKYIVLTNNKTYINNSHLNIPDINDYDNWISQKITYDINYNVEKKAIPSINVKTIIHEILPNIFQVQEEYISDDIEGGYAIIQYLDGKRDELSYINVNDLSNTYLMALAASDMQPQYECLNCITKGTLHRFQPTYNHKIHTLPYVLIGSSFGYYIGKPLEVLPNPNVYKYPYFNTPNSGLLKKHPNNNSLYEILVSTAIYRDRTSSDLPFGYTSNLPTIANYNIAKALDNSHLHYLSSIEISPLLKSNYSNLYKGNYLYFFADNTRWAIPYYLLFMLNGIAIFLYAKRIRKAFKEEKKVPIFSNSKTKAAIPKKLQQGIPQQFIINSQVRSQYRTSHYIIEEGGKGYFSSNKKKP